MILNSDFLLTHPLWERADNELCSKEGLSIFNRLVDVFIIACSIGIREDKIILDENTSTVKSIGRNTYMSPQNTDLMDTLQFMLQNALINSKTIDLSADERLRLAFDPEYTVKNLSPVNFLIGFANYGIEQIFKHIDSQSSLVALDELYKYFSSLEEKKYDEILKNITLDVLN